MTEQSAVLANLTGHSEELLQNEKALVAYDDAEAAGNLKWVNPYEDDSSIPIPKSMSKLHKIVENEKPAEEFSLLTPHSPVRALKDIRYKYTNTVFYDPYIDEYNEKYPPREPQWIVYQKELKRGAGRGLTRKMKTELAYKCKFVHESRYMLRILLGWRGFIDQFTYLREMLVRVHRLKFVHKCFAHWWLSNRREKKLKTILDTICLKLLYRRFRLWCFMTREYRNTRRMARVCFANWQFYLIYRKNLFEQLAKIAYKSKMISAATMVQKRWRGMRARKGFKSKNKIFKGLFWGSKLWRRVYRARQVLEIRRKEKEDGLLDLVVSRTLLAVKDYIGTLEGMDEFQKFQQKVTEHYRDHDLDFAYDEVDDVWKDCKRKVDQKIDRVKLPGLLRSAMKDAVRNFGDVASVVAVTTQDRTKCYRIIEDRCVRDVRAKARVYYRRKHPPPYQCSKCFKVFMFQCQLDSHEKMSRDDIDCTPKESLSRGYAWYNAGPFSDRIIDDIMKIFYADVYDEQNM